MHSVKKKQNEKTKLPIFIHGLLKNKQRKQNNNNNKQPPPPKKPTKNNNNNNNNNNKKRTKTPTNLARKIIEFRLVRQITQKIIRSGCYWVCK